MHSRSTAFRSGRTTAYIWLAPAVARPIFCSAALHKTSDIRKRYTQLVWPKTERQTLKNKLKERYKQQKIIVVALLIIVYLAADILMDIILFPMLTESLKEHHKEIVARYMIFFGLIPVWIIGYLCFEKRENKLAKLAAIIFGSALVATVIYAFMALPLVWIASTFTSLLASTSLFLHDYGLFVFFVIIIPIFGYKYFKKRKEK